MNLRERAVKAEARVAHLEAALAFFADGGYYEEGRRPLKVPWPLQVKAREALAVTDTFPTHTTPRTGR